MGLKETAEVVRAKVDNLTVVANELRILSKSSKHSGNKGG